MESYYSRLTELKTNVSIRQEIRINKQQTSETREKKPIWEDKISALFGIDQNSQKAKKVELNIFKNLHLASDNRERNNLPNLMNFQRKKTNSGKFDTEFQKDPHFVRRMTKIDFNFTKLKSTMIEKYQFYKFKEI